MKLKHKQKAERFVLEINESVKKLSLARKKLAGGWPFSGKWELAKQEAESQFERAWLGLAHVIQRYKESTRLNSYKEEEGDEVFDWTVLAGLDNWLHADAMYREVFPDHEMGSTSRDQDIYGGQRPSEFE